MNGDYLPLVKADSNPRNRQKEIQLDSKIIRIVFQQIFDAIIYCSIQNFKTLIFYLINTPDKAEREKKFSFFLVWLFKLFISEKAHRTTASNNHKETDS